MYIRYCQFLLDVFLIWYANMYLYCIYSAEKKHVLIFTQVPPAMKSSKCQKSSWSGPNDVRIYSRDCQIFPYYSRKNSHTSDGSGYGNVGPIVWEIRGISLVQCGDHVAISKIPYLNHKFIHSTKTVGFPNRKVGGLDFAEHSDVFRDVSTKTSPLDQQKNHQNRWTTRNFWQLWKSKTYASVRNLDHEYWNGAVTC